MVGELGAAQRVDRLLRPAYPGRRRRAHLIRWLGWIAHHTSADRDFTLQNLPTRIRDARSSQWLTRLFDDAVEHGVLSRSKLGYRFADPAVQAALAASYDAMAAGTAAKVIAFLGARDIDRELRLIVDGVFCVGIIAAVLDWQVVSQWSWWVYPLALVFCVPSAVVCVAFGVVPVMSVAALLVAGPTLTRLHRALWAMAIVAAIGLITALIGTARVIPAALVAACGVLVCVLINRLVHATRRHWRKALLKPIVDVVAIATVSATVLVLSHDDLLTTMPAAGFLFPLAIWGSVRVWRAMTGSGRLPVRAAADIVLSLLSGGVFVVFLVWLADTFGMPRGEMAALRATLARTGDVADLSWWVWTTLYALLAGLYLVFVHWPVPMATLIERFKRLRVVPVTNASRRVLTGVHIGLLAIMLVGLAAPLTLTVTLQHRLAAMYQVAVQREFEADGERLAYQQIQQRFTTGSSGPDQPLTSMVVAVEDNSMPGSDDESKQSVESDVAQGLGQLQAATLHMAGTRLLMTAEQDAVQTAGLEATVRDATDATDRIEQVEAEQDRAETATRNAELAGELAATAVASVVSVPSLPKSEIVEVVREYLSGLIEASPLKDVFATWARRLSGATTLPAAESMVVPDADRLRLAAVDDLSGVLDAAGDAAAVTAAKTKSPLDSAADLIDQTHVVQTNDGDCAGCGSGGGGGQGDVEVPGEQPIVIDDGG
jgi:hypothetical protein